MVEKTFSSDDDLEELTVDESTESGDIYGNG